MMGFCLLTQPEELKMATQLTGPVMPIKNVSATASSLGIILESLRLGKILKVIDHKPSATKSALSHIPD